MATVSLKQEQKGTKSIFLWLFVLALLVSLGVHFLFFETTQSWVISGFSPDAYDQIIPRTFRMKRVEIDPKVLEVQVEVDKKTLLPPVQLDQERPFDRVQEQANKQTPLSKPKELNQELLPREMPGMATATMEGAKILAGIQMPADAGKNPALKTILEPPVSDDMALPTIPIGKGEEEKKYSSLDALLAGKETVTSATAPILMPTDLLFGYDDDILKPEAAQALAKLGALIQRNALAKFRIEGHTDSFGNDDYNNALSLRRAEAVRRWLQEKMGIDPNLMTTAGFGKSRLLAPASGTVDDQQINRRVEIVIPTQ